MSSERNYANRSHRGCSLAVLGAALALPAVVGAASVRPKNLLMYYGYPSSINMTFSVPAAALEFGRYDYVVWGDGLEDLTHPDHANAVAILGEPAVDSTRFFGFVDLGVSTQNLPMAEVQARIARWKAMGVSGVLFDDFGYDFGVNRTRQNAAVDYAHAQGLAAIANALRPEETFGNRVDPVYNPSGAPTSLRSTDFYLYESHGVWLGAFEDGAAWQAKADTLEAYRRALGFRVFSTTTTATDDPGAYADSLFFYAWHAALLGGHEATGWGEFGFSSHGASNGQAPFRTRPVLEPGSTFTTALAHSGSYHSRHTDQGIIWLDSVEHTFGFTPGQLGVGDPVDAAARTLIAAPNPMRAEARIGFTLPRRQAVHLVIYSAGGGQVAVLAAGELAPGQHDMLWNGCDRDGRPVASGVYFAALETGGHRQVARVVVLR